MSKKNNIKNDELALLVFKTLLMVVRKHSQYFLFRCGIGAESDKMVSFLKYASNLKKDRELSNDTQFSNVNNYLEVIDAMVVSLGLNKRENISQEETQKIVLHYTNNLLHFCLEPFLRDFNLLEEIGKETFESVCKNVLGDDFVDTIVDEKMENVLSKLKGLGKMRIDEDFVRYIMDKINNNNSNFNLDMVNLLDSDLPF